MLNIVDNILCTSSIQSTLDDNNIYVRVDRADS